MKERKRKLIKKEAILSDQWKEWLNAKGTEVKVQRNQEMVLTFIPKPTMIDSGKKSFD